MLPNVFEARCKKIESVLSAGDIRMLEIGAFDRPTYDPAKYNIDFLDYRTTEELRNLAKRSLGRNCDDVVAVDYVATSNFISREVEGVYDLIIGNHLIEHIPNLLAWLIDLRKIIVPGGKIFLSVPDRRYTFDYLRRETSFLDTLRAYYEGTEKPTFWAILDARYYEKPELQGVEGWHPEVVQERIEKRRYDWAGAVALAKIEASKPYVDVHCSVFTKQSFETLFSDMLDAGVAPFVIESIEEVERGNIEFHVILARNEDFQVSAVLSPPDRGLNPPLPI